MSGLASHRSFSVNAFTAALFTGWLHLHWNVSSCRLRQCEQAAILRLDPAVCVVEAPWWLHGHTQTQQPFYRGNHKKFTPDFGTRLKTLYNNALDSSILIKFFSFVSGAPESIWLSLECCLPSVLELDRFLAPAGGCSAYCRVTRT